MINNETAKMTYTIIEGVNTYAIGFSYAKNPDGTPQIKVYLNKISITPLVYGVDYTLSEDGLSIILASVTSGDRLDIIRDIPLVQLSDYVIGRIDPEQIENDFDKTVMRDQQIQANIDFVGEVPEDHEVRIQECETDIDNIESLIPNQTTSVNQLADKEFVNSSIATSTATFRGTYSSLAELEAITADDNDYGFVESVDAAGNTLYSRYKYSNNAWVFEYNLNNSSFTAAQWAAINSGITADIVNTFDATGHNVGDTFTTMRNDNELNGAVECNGATYNTTDFTGAESIGALLEAGKIDYISLTAYADAITQKGWCDKIGWNGTGNTQFRVPTLNAYIWQKLQIGVVGDGTELGFDYNSNKAYMNSHNESLGNNAGWIGTYMSGSETKTSIGNMKVSTDATQSGLVAGASTDISQQRVMIQLAIVATDEAVETCTSVLADVATLKGYDYVVEFQAPTAENNYTWYRKYKSGWVEQGGIVSVPSQLQATVVNLVIEMANTNYNVVATINTLGTTWGTEFGMHAAQTSTMTISLQHGSSANPSNISWQVSGMAA